MSVSQKADLPPAFLGVESSVSGQRWQRRPFCERTAAALAQREGLDPLIAEVAVARGATLETAELFLRPTLKSAMPDPSSLTDMDKAAARIADAIMAEEPIGIFGDYDVDGTTSSAILARYFRSLGVEAHVHLPDRQLEGYGPNIEAFRSLTEKGAKLILTADCGAAAYDVLAQAAEEGMEVIVLDHHGMTLPAPIAHAIVNPNRPDDTSGLGQLSAGGVVFMTLVAVNRALRGRGAFGEDRREPNLLQWLDLVALSLVCDVMPLQGLTRVLTRQGLAILGTMGPEGRGNPGIRALAAEAGAKGVAQASHFGFAIGPRINAAGRIGHAKTAFELLTTDDPSEAAALAEQLSDLNGARQGVEATVQEEAMGLAETLGGREADTPLVVAGDNWHQGVIGIVAGRLKERFHRPSLIVSFEGEAGKGSGRSLPGVDLGAAIQEAASLGLIEGGGGHPMAAGLSLTRTQLEPFREWLATRLGPDTEKARATRSYTLDGAVGIAAVTKGFHDAFSAVGPFGNGNPEPRFVVRDVRVRDIRVLKEKHIAATLTDEFGRRLRAISFGCVGAPLGDFFMAAQDGRPVHIAGRIKPDDWRGGDAAQLQVDDAAFAEEV